MHCGAGSENDGLPRQLSSHLSGHRPVESDSHKTFGFSVRKSCFKNRLAISDESAVAKTLAASDCAARRAIRASQRDRRLILRTGGADRGRDDGTGNEGGEQQHELPGANPHGRAR